MSLQRDSRRDEEAPGALGLENPVSYLFVEQKSIFSRVPVSVVESLVSFVSGFSGKIRVDPSEIGGWDKASQHDTLFFYSLIIIVSLALFLFFSLEDRRLERKDELS